MFFQVLAKGQIMSTIDWNIVIEVVGWCGTIALLGAYLLLSIGKINGKSRIYHFLNFTGAISLGVNAYTKTNYQVVVIECVWSSIALWSLFNLLRKKT